VAAARRPGGDAPGILPSSPIFRSASSFFFDPNSWLYPASTSAIPSIKMSFIRKIVHNDAVKLDPPEVYNWRVFALAAAACFGGTLFGMDIGENIQIVVFYL
jgi:hypothetical protein